MSRFPGAVTGGWEGQLVPLAAVDVRDDQEMSALRASMISDHLLLRVVTQFVGEAQVPPQFHDRQEPLLRSRVSMQVRTCRAKER